MSCTIFFTSIILDVSFDIIIMCYCLYHSMWMPWNKIRSVKCTRRCKRKTRYCNIQWKDFWKYAVTDVGGKIWRMWKRERQCACMSERIPLMFLYVIHWIAWTRGKGFTKWKETQKTINKFYPQRTIFCCSVLTCNKVSVCWVQHFQRTKKREREREGMERYWRQNSVGWKDNAEYYLITEWLLQKYSKTFNILSLSRCVFCY